MAILKALSGEPDELWKVDWENELDWFLEKRNWLNADHRSFQGHSRRSERSRQFVGNVAGNLSFQLPVRPAELLLFLALTGGDREKIVPWSTLRAEYISPLLKKFYFFLFKGIDLENGKYGFQAKRHLYEPCDTSGCGSPEDLFLLGNWTSFLLKEAIGDSHARATGLAFFILSPRESVSEQVISRWAGSIFQAPRVVRYFFDLILYFKTGSHLMNRQIAAGLQRQEFENSIRDARAVLGDLMVRDSGEVYPAILADERLLFGLARAGNLESAGVLADYLRKFPTGLSRVARCLENTRKQFPAAFAGEADLYQDDERIFLKKEQTTAGHLVWRTRDPYLIFDFWNQALEPAWKRRMLPNGIEGDFARAYITRMGENRLRQTEGILRARPGSTLPGVRWSDIATGKGKEEGPVKESRQLTADNLKWMEKRLRAEAEEEIRNLMVEKGQLIARIEQTYDDLGREKEDRVRQWRNELKKGFTLKLKSMSLPDRLRAIADHDVFGLTHALISDIRPFPPEELRECSPRVLRSLADRLAGTHSKRLRARRRKILEALG